MAENRKNFPEMEEAILASWKKNNIFEKSITQNEGGKDFVFYDGPPFANGLPHNGHILSSVSKDLIGRYKTMRGYKVLRRWGWDCHGLPVESHVEKELGINGKKEIEAYGIEPFNKACEASVMKYDKEWEEAVYRWGRFVDFKNNYKTMNPSYIESVWWGFEQLHKKGFIYEDIRISLYCPRCETPLSNFEIAMDNSYKNVEDPSIYVKFKLADTKNEYLLIWTTTPWTLPANSAVAVNPKIEYARVQVGDSFYWIAYDLFEALKPQLPDGKIVDTFKGVDLIGKKYEPVFNYFEPTKANSFSIVAGDFVTTTDGTGLVHIAPTFGDDDYKTGKEFSLDFFETVDSHGAFLPIASDFAGKGVWKSNVDVIENLKSRDLVTLVLPIKHEYPYCYRCDNKLIYKTQSAWFVKVSAFKDRMIELNKQINWHPEHLKEGRFGKGLETAPDWNISRSRFWGNPLPIWKCSECKNLEVIGSIETLSKKIGKEVKGLHRPEIDNYTWDCQCSKGAKFIRIPEVFDCWFESGSMPWASVHYPFENKEFFENNYPAEFIAEYIAQTRGWFYTLHVLATGIFDKPSFINALTTGTILASDGQKMSKSKKNYTDPMELINKYGMDSMRYYLLASPLMNAENLNYSDKEQAEYFGKIIMLVWNVYTFYEPYASLYKEVDVYSSKNVLDQWIISKLQTLIKEITETLESYEITRATRKIGEFIDELSTWYLRRSRDRFKDDENPDDQVMVVATMKYVLLELSKVMAPFMPYISEELYFKVGGTKESVHLEKWPEAIVTAIKSDVIENMIVARALIEKALAIRATQNIKIRQALGNLYINKVSLDDGYHSIIADEVNVKNIIATKDLPAESKSMKINADDSFKVALDLVITEELKKEGDLREIVRGVNNYRKELLLTPNDIVSLKYFSEDTDLSKLVEESRVEIIKSTRLKELAVSEKSDNGVEIKVNGRLLWISIQK